MGVDNLRFVIYYLENYASDLNFQLSHGSDFVNYCTDETPEFEDDESAEAYIRKLERFITELKARFDYLTGKVTQDEG